ncbi:NAD(+) synthase [Candidatus Woesearchaeota archaeon]|jgi:NAD+ synthase|nr:NAD(+) synthase [Candidatus Woesearchaeota archaeon]MBT6519064.1 NAD(+) synthase [Candidatus Woesearchaeota archaeon]MBT7366872.1 NAD(+) synthase [Candidatus Woesearchaeota archaeon]
MNKRIYNVDLENITQETLTELKTQYMQNPMSLLEVDKEDADFLTKRITGMMKDYLEGCGLGGYVVGLSGGIDSSLVLDLSVEAVGAENVLGLMISSGKTSQESVDFAKRLADHYDVAHASVDKRLFEMAITVDNLIEEDIERQLVEQGRWKHQPSDYIAMRIGNDHARQRMKILRRQTAKYGCLVNGTTNDTEQLLAYFTIGGDGRGGVDIESIVKLPKTSEYQFARHRNLPQEVVDRIPSAELMDGHTDEGELSRSLGHKVSYQTIDLMLTGRKLGLDAEEIVKANNSPLITKECIGALYKFCDRMSFKTKPEPYADLIQFT